MTDDNFDNERILLGSILTTDEADDMPECISAKCWQDKKNKQGLERESQTGMNTQDHFRQSFEQISFVSDYLESPITPESQIFQKGFYNQASSSFSFDGQSTQENSLIVGVSYGFEPFLKQQEQISPVMFNQTSQLWMKFQNMNQPNFDAQLQADIDIMCGNQQLSRKVQKIFETGTNNQKQQIFVKVESSCLEFSKDIFGNYLVQKILERGSLQQRRQIFIQIKPYFFEISTNTFGCRVIQKLIEVISIDEKLIDLIIELVKMNIKNLLKDQNGKYVILKLLEVFQREKLEFLIAPIEDQCKNMCSSQYGCKILLKIIDYYPSNMEKLLKNCLVNQAYLYQSEFGNHILQFALKNLRFTNKIVGYALENLEQLCFNKYASNSVEALLDYLNQEQKRDLVNKLMSQSQLNSQLLFVNISINPFGNYVIKRLLQQFNQELLQPVFQHMKSYPNLLLLIRYSEFGQRIFTLLSTQLNDDNENKYI